MNLFGVFILIDSMTCSLLSCLNWHKMLKSQTEHKIDTIHRHISSSSFEERRHQQKRLFSKV